jgi:hypothetical protein
MPSLPKKAVLDLRCDKLYIDGAEFPWYISEDGIQVSGLGARDAVPALTFTIFADSIEVIPADDAETTTK